MSSKEKLPSLTQFSSDRPEIEACELVFVTWQIPNLVLEKNLYQLIMLQSSAEFWFLMDKMAQELPHATAAPHAPRKTKPYEMSWSKI